MINKKSKKNKLTSTKAKAKTKTKSKTKKNLYISNYDPNQDYFKTNARLNSSQRKYCHCLMNVRKNKKSVSPYPICISFMKKQKILDYNLKSNKYNYKKSKKTPLKVNPKITHCLMNYDLYKYDIQQVRHLAQEKKIPIYYLTKSNRKNNKKHKKHLTNKKTKKTYLTKNTLISKIIDNYLIKTKKKSKYL